MSNIPFYYYELIAYTQKQNNFLS